jgi:hypothetical protein
MAILCGRDDDDSFRPQAEQLLRSFEASEGRPATDYLGARAMVNADACSTATGSGSPAFRAQSIARFAERIRTRFDARMPDSRTISQPMCRTWIGILCGAALLAACSDSATKLSKDEEQVLDAMMFLFSGIEDNTKDDTGLTPWRREVKGRSIEFSKLGKNGIGSSDEEENQKIRQSTYVRYLERISLKEPCVFHFEEITEFSKGDSQEDFSWHSFKNALNTDIIFNLANAHVFNLNVEDAKSTKALIELAGPRVECTEYGFCENAWNSFFSGMDLGRFHGGDFENNRRLRAVELIKKVCPGKPF